MTWYWASSVKWLGWPQVCNMVVVNSCAETSQPSERVWVLGLSVLHPLHCYQTSALSGYLINLFVLSSEIPAKMASEAVGAFQSAPIPSAPWLWRIASPVSCKQPLLHKLIASLSHLLTERLGECFNCTHLCPDCKNIIDTQSRLRGILRDWW